MSRKLLKTYPDIPGKRAEMPEASLEERSATFVEAELGFPEDVARAEARRCLGCRGCLGCGLCQVVCKPKAIDFDQNDQEIEIDADEIILTPGVCQVSPVVDDKYGYGRFPDVLMGPEFEQILSGDGPFCGELLRPSNGDIPERIAFVACDVPGLTGETLERSRRLSLRYGLRLASDAVSTKPGVQVVVVSSLPQGEVEAREDATPGALLDLTMAEVRRVIEANDGRLILEWSDENGPAGERFDMVVLCTGFNLADVVGEWARKLGLGLEGQLFWPADDAQVATARPGVCLAGMTSV